MTTVEFYGKDGSLTGFKIVGHSTANADDLTGKIVCSAISSASIMVANTVTDIIGAEADVSVNDAELSVTLKTKLPECQSLLCGLRLHFSELEKQYRNYMKVYSEV